MFPSLHASNGTRYWGYRRGQDLCGARVLLFFLREPSLFLFSRLKLLTFVDRSFLGEVVTAKQSAKMRARQNVSENNPTSAFVLRQRCSIFLKLLRYLVEGFTEKISNHSSVKVEGVSKKLDRVRQISLALFITFERNHLL